MHAYFDTFAVHTVIRSGYDNGTVRLSGKISNDTRFPDGANIVHTSPVVSIMGNGQVRTFSGTIYDLNIATPDGAQAWVALLLAYQAWYMTVYGQDPF